MYNVSSKYVELVQENTRTWDIYIDVKLSNGTMFKLTKDNIDLGSFKLKEGSTCSDSIQIGSTYSNSIEFRIINNEGSLTEYDFYRAKLWPYVGLDLTGDSDFEYVPLGEFNIIDNVKKFSTISIVGFDNMCLLNQAFDSSHLVFPALASNLIAEIAQQCNVKVTEELMQDIGSLSQQINSLLSKEYTCRDVLVGLGILLLKNLRFNRLGALESFWYDECNRETNENTRVKNSSYGDNIVEVTGVYLEDMYGSTYTVGNDANAIALPFSPIIQGSEMSKDILEASIVKLTSLKYRPSTITWIGDPSIQAGDILKHTNTAVGDCVIPIMRLVYTFAGTETLESLGMDTTSTEQPNSTERKAKQAFAKSEKDKGELQTAIKQTTDSITLEVSAGSVGNKAEIKLSVAGKEYLGYIDLTGLVTFYDLSTKGKTTIVGDNITTGTIDASLIKAGVIKSKDDSVQFDLDHNRIILEDPDTVTRFELSSTGINGYGQNKINERLEGTLSIHAGQNLPGGAQMTSSILGRNGVMLLVGSDGGGVMIGNPGDSVIIGGDELVIGARVAFWRDNGDGTSSLTCRN